MKDDLISKADALAIIDSVMNNREIDSIRNAILAIRDQVVEMREEPPRITGDLVRKVCRACNEMKDERQCCPFDYPCEQIELAKVGDYWEVRSEAWMDCIKSLEFGNTDLMLHVYEHRKR